MKLEDFIEETLTGIVMGVVAAQKGVAGTGADISPMHVKGPMGTPSGAGSNYISEVVFEVALTISEDQNNKTGIGVYFGGLGIGGQKNDGTKNESVTNVKFSVPVSLPKIGEKPKGKARNKPEPYD